MSSSCRMNHWNDVEHETSWDGFGLTNSMMKLRWCLFACFRIFSRVFLAITRNNEKNPKSCKDWPPYSRDLYIMKQKLQCLCIASMSYFYTLIWVSRHKIRHSLRYACNLQMHLKNPVPSVPPSGFRSIACLLKSLKKATHYEYTDT